MSLSMKNNAMEVHILSSYHSWISAFSRKSGIN